MKRILGPQDPLTEASVGGKLARQQRMAADGIPVPRFFSLSGALFAEVLAPIRETIGARLRQIDFERSASVQEGSAAIARLFETLELPASLQAEILAAYDRTFAEGTLVAVRASTVGHRLEESEDSATNPFAGMSETFLFVPRAQLLDRVRRCWASGFSPESLVYRHAQRMDLMGFSVAVAVQQMVFGVRSFVLFTCDPQTALRDAVVVAGHGVGEGVVQERVGVDHYFVNRRTGEIRTQPGERTEMLVFDEAAGSGLVARPVPEALRGAPCLREEELRALVALGERIERIFGAPQDIEGTLTAEGEVHVLQSRPVALDFRTVRVWSNANVTESFPGVTTALTYSFARYFYRVIFEDCYRRLGVSPRRLHDNAAWLERMIGFLGGRVYYCLTSFYELHGQSPLFPLFRANWERMMGFRSSIQEPPRGALARLGSKLLAVGRFTFAAAVVGWRFATHGRAMMRFHRWWEGLCGPRRGRLFHESDPVALIGDFHGVWAQVGREWGVTLLNDTYLPMIHGTVEGLMRRWGLAAEEGLFSALLCGDEELLSVSIILSAVELGETVHGDPALARAFAERTPAQLWTDLEAGKLPEAFARAVREHLHRYGDRGLQELKVEVPNLRHEPWRLLESVQAYARRGVSVAQIKEGERQVRAEADRKLAALLRRRPLRRAVLVSLLALLRRLVRNRENSRYCRSELYGYSKNVFRALGRALVARGVLRSAEDAYDLTMEELFGWFDGTGVTRDLQALADLRKREREELARCVLPMEVTTVGAVDGMRLGTAPSAPSGMSGPEAERPRALRGLGSSAGRVRGRAKVVIDPQACTDLGDDAILVARETDPGWLFLMLRARGIVVERGSMLSHTAITGRKFGIPTIVAVPEATERIPDGAWVEMDGASGQLTILESPEEAVAKTGS